MMPARNAWLAEAARAEHARRVARGPALVAEGKADRADVAADVAAWDAIARLFAEGSVETGLSWADLCRAADRGHEAVAAAAARSPADPARLARLAAVQAIADRLQWHRATFGPLAALYAAAEASEAA